METNPEKSASSPDAVERLIPLVYDELRRIAHRELRGERGVVTITTTALVHEAFLRLSASTPEVARDRLSFLAAATRVMRRVLVDYARRQVAVKRGGQWQRVDLTDGALPIADRPQLVIELEAALQRLAELDERMSRIVECRFFGGLTEEETAAVLGISVRTVRREWTKARGWLYQELRA